MNMRALLLLPFIGVATISNAQVNYGGEFQFAQVSSHIYSIELRLYLDPNGQEDPPWVIVNFGDGGVDTVNVNSTVIEGNNACGSQVEVRTFTTQHVYPGPGSYVLTCNVHNRISDVTNIPGSVNVPLCVPALLVISSAGADSSPIFMNDQNNSYFNGTVFTHDPQVYDADGDSLTFDIVVPHGQNCEPIPDYLFPDEIQQGISTMSIDPHTGVFQWSDPPLSGYTSIAIQCTEWRDGTMLGQVLRDMTLCVPASLTGIIEQADRPMLSIVPTVSAGEVEVITNNAQGVIELTDMQGRFLRRIALSSDHTMLDTRSLSPGTYLLRLIQDGAVIATGRFIISQR